MPTNYVNRVSTHPGLNQPMDKYHNEDSSNGIPGFATFEAGRLQQKVAVARIGHGYETPLVSAGTSGTSGSWSMASGANGSLTNANSGLTVTSSAQNVETTIKNGWTVPATALGVGDKISAFVRFTNADISEVDVMLSLGAASDTPITATDGGSALTDVIAVWYDESADKFKGSVNGNAGTQVDVEITSTSATADGSSTGMGFFAEFGPTAATSKGHFVFINASGTKTTIPFTSAQLTLLFAMLTTQPVLVWQYSQRNTENGSNYTVIDYLACEVDR